jgi:hypothetical protein
MLSQALLLNLANEYVEEVRTKAKVTSKDIVEPVLLPDKGIWHPVADKVRLWHACSHCALHLIHNHDVNI